MNNATTSTGNGGDFSCAENFAAPPRGPVDAIRTCLVKFFDFRGRASRSEFWWFFAAVMALALLEALLPESLATAGFLLTAVVVQPPLWAVTVRRLHDTNRTGWWIFPYVHLVALNAAVGLYLLYSTGAVYWRGDFPIRLLLDLFVPIGVASQAALYVFAIYTALVVAGHFILVLFCLTKGKPEQNRFDRGGEPFGFSFNQRPA